MVIMSRQSVIKNKKIEKRKNVSKKIVTIVDVKNYVGQEVTIGAWVANKSGKGKIAFLQLRDGSAFFQGVAFKPNFIEKFGEEEGLAKFDTIKKLSQETSVYVTGIVKEDERSKFGYELDITDIEIIGESNDDGFLIFRHGIQDQSQRHDQEPWHLLPDKADLTDSSMLEFRSSLFQRAQLSLLLHFLTKLGYQIS